MKKKLFIAISALVLACVGVLAWLYFSAPQIQMAGPGEESLKTLPYVSYTSPVSNPKDSGVTVNKAGQTFPGYNLFPSVKNNTAYLMDMSGKIVHQWHVPLDIKDIWYHITLAKNGDLFFMLRDKIIGRLSPDNKVKWMVDTLRPHHDITEAPNGDVYVLHRRQAVMKRPAHSLPVLVDQIAVLNSEGKQIRNLDLFNTFGPYLAKNAFDRLEKWVEENPDVKEFINDPKGSDVVLVNDTPADLFHTNSLVILDRDVKGLGEKGNLLICLRHFNLIAVIDEKTGALRWKWGNGVLDSPHHPTLLDNGNILIFDNGRNRGWSRVIELNPETKEIVWEFKTDPPQNFYSQFRGASQRLPNGNTLITESDRARVLEVTKKGEVVWEYIHFEMNEDETRRGTFYRMERIPFESVTFLPKE